MFHTWLAEYFFRLEGRVAWSEVNVNVRFDRLKPKTTPVSYEPKARFSIVLMVCAVSNLAAEAFQAEDFHSNAAKDKIDLEYWS